MTGVTGELLGNKEELLRDSLTSFWSQNLCFPRKHSFYPNPSLLSFYLNMRTETSPPG